MQRMPRSKSGDTTEREYRPVEQLAANDARRARRSVFAFAGVERGRGVHVPRAPAAGLRQTEAPPPRQGPVRHRVEPPSPPDGDHPFTGITHDSTGAGAPPNARRIAS